MSVWILITQCVAFVILVNNFFSLIFRISEQQHPDINNKGIKNRTKIFKTKIDSWDDEYDAQEHVSGPKCMCTLWCYIFTFVL